MISAQAAPVPVSPPCCLTTIVTPWSRAIGPSCLNRSTQSLRLPPLVWPNVSTCGIPAAAACRMRDCSTSSASACLGIDHREHHQRLQAQVAALLAQLLGPSGGRIGGDHRHRLLPSSWCVVPQATYSIPGRLDAVSARSSGNREYGSVMQAIWNCVGFPRRRRRAVRAGIRLDVRAGRSHRRTRPATPAPDIASQARRVRVAGFRSEMSCRMFHPRGGATGEHTVWIRVPRSYRLPTPPAKPWPRPTHSCTARRSTRQAQDALRAIRLAPRPVHRSTQGLFPKERHGPTRPGRHARRADRSRVAR